MGIAQINTSNWGGCRMKRIVILFCVVVVLMTLAGCAAGPNTLTGSPDREGEVAGFWLGLWQGIIAPVTFIISLFSDKVDMYEVHNNGGWYNFGFLLGIMIIFGGSGGGAARGRRR
jgi:predicted small secreted protein